MTTFVFDHNGEIKEALECALEPPDASEYDELVKAINQLLLWRNRREFIGIVNLNSHSRVWAESGGVGVIMPPFGHTSPLARP